ncbi:HDOD domain-containing protein [Methylomonas fluvii]|uniref:HDOD domain-containing protein n=1 Tax=Methylomonas fluvii TaxID=1854564 RepID=A0ABR9DCS1_9GAMM|nr:HDOD domain-containing protein [Methylomonas fluvii]MBD9360636.1 HDOD domain-containing protein [Methylomonas fluvii]CAD6873482.1 metal dependent phosphohydrolase [Methylomonas fluvii]
MLDPVKIDSQADLIEHTLQEIKGLVSLPEVYQKVRNLIDDPNSDIEHFVEVVASDSNLSVAVLRVANSAFFGFPGKIDSLSRAVNMLGIGQLHDLVLATSAIGSLKLPNDIMPLKTFWRFSLFSAVLTRLLAIQLKIPKSERLFVIGLLYEIGHLVLYAKHPDLAMRAMELSQHSQELLHIAEQKLLGMHYGEIGAKLMAQWRLPVHFQDIVHYQPTPDLAPEQRKETALLHLVRACAEKYISGHMDAIEESVSADIWDILQLNADQLADTVEQALKAATEMEKLMFN